MTTRGDDRVRGARSFWVWLAWGSVLSGLAVVAALLLEELDLVRFPPDDRGMHPGEAKYYEILFVASVAGGLAAIASLSGVRSKRRALSIIPGALLGLGINVLAAFISYIARGFVDFNPWPD